MKKFCGALFALAMAVGLTACADAPTPEKIIRANRDIFSEGKYSVAVNADFQINIISAAFSRKKQALLQPSI